MIKTIAYLAPEITSISSTFVYKEIFALQDKGIKVIPISVHQPQAINQDLRVTELSKNTIYLYQQSLIVAIILSTILLFKRPRKYISTLLTVFKDITNSGLNKFQSWKLLYQLFYASIVAETINKNSCQHLHIHFAHVPTQIGMYASLLTGVPYSFTSHANDIFDNSSLLKEKVERAKTAITISEYNYHFLAQQGIDVEKLTIVRCGIENHHNYVPKLNFQKTPKIGSLGRFVEKKGMEDLILALSKLHQEGTDFCLEIGGDGYLKDYLKDLVKQHNLERKTTFKGAIPNHQVYSWLKELDIFILACKEDSNGDKDGIPVVLMEAMNIGIPVISTKISGIPELIQDESSGFLAQPNDPESLANTINKLLGLSHSISQITQAAKDRIREEFAMDKNINRLLAVFDVS